MMITIANVPFYGLELLLMRELNKYLNIYAAQLTELKKRFADPGVVEPDGKKATLDKLFKDIRREYKNNADYFGIYGTKLHLILV